MEECIGDGNGDGVEAMATVSVPIALRTGKM